MYQNRCLLSSPSQYTQQAGRGAASSPSAEGHRVARMGPERQGKSLKVLDDGVALAWRARKQAQRDDEIRLRWGWKARPGWVVLTVTDVGTHVLKLRVTRHLECTSRGICRGSFTLRK